MMKSLALSPAAIHIETKRIGVKSDGKIQLGVWVSALHKRFYTLFGDDIKIPSIPLLIAEGPTWTLLLACQTEKGRPGKAITILGPMDIGNTKKVDSCYRLLAILRALVHWADTDFRKWIEEQVGRLHRDLTSNDIFGDL